MLQEQKDDTGFRIRIKRWSVPDSGGSVPACSKDRVMRVDCEGWWYDGRYEDGRYRLSEALHGNRGRSRKGTGGEYDPFEEAADGSHHFTVPVEALDKELDCAAFSKKKEKWYDRVLVFRADSLPADALTDAAQVTAETLGLADGCYTVEVSMEGGSGRVSVESPAKLVVKDQKAVAEVVWSSPNYDYMKVGEEKSSGQSGRRNFCV